MGFNIKKQMSDNFVFSKKIGPMKNVILFLGLLLAPFMLSAQERLNDTVVGGVRYAILLDKDGEVESYRSSVPFDGSQAVIDLNRRLRRCAVRQTTAISCGVAGAACVLAGLKAESPAIRWVGYGALGVGALFGVLSVAPLWTDRLYVNQDGLVFRLDGRKKAYYRHELGKEDE